MTQKQLEKLVSLYKQAIEKNLSTKEFSKEMLDAKISLDRSFVENERQEDVNIVEYIKELDQLLKYTSE